MAVNGPTKPQVPTVQKVEMMPTHGGGQTEITGTDGGKTSTAPGTAPQGNTNAAAQTAGSNNRQEAADAPRTNNSTNTTTQSATDGKSADRNSQEQNAAATGGAQAIQLPAASTEKETQNQTLQGTQQPAAFGEHGMIGAYWPLLLVFAAALIYFMYRSYRKGNTVEINQRITLRELLEEENKSRDNDSIKTLSEEQAATPPPAKPQVKKEGGHIEIRV